jgi:hypothetical protein
VSNVAESKDSRNRRDGEGLDGGDPVTLEVRPLYCFAAGRVTGRDSRLFTQLAQTRAPPAVWKPRRAHAGTRERDAARRDRDRGAMLSVEGTTE